MDCTVFSIVGGGRRTEFLLRLAEAAPDLLRVAGVVTRSAGAAERVAKRWSVPTYRSIDDLRRAGGGNFVAAAVPWLAMPGVIRELAEAHMHVLSETHRGPRPRRAAVAVVRRRPLGPRASR